MSVEMGCFNFEYLQLYCSVYFSVDVLSSYSAFDFVV